MLKNHLKTAIRNLWRRRSSTLINILGLSLGIVSCLLILLFVKNELTYDSFHEKSNRTYQLVIQFGQGDSFQEIGLTAPPMGPALVEEFPEVESATRFRRTYREDAVLKYEDKEFYESNFYATDQSFFDIFSFEVIKGSSQESLTDPYTLVLTESIARKYFGDANPINKTIQVNGSELFQVKAVIADFPSNSHLNFDLLTSYKTIESLGRPVDNWHAMNSWTYLSLKPNTILADFQKKTLEFLDRHTGEQTKEWGITYEFILEPLKDIYLKATHQYPLGVRGEAKYVYFFSVIGLIILALSCINFINLVTARSTERAKEVGIRKTVGAKREHLISQFLVESFLVATSALVVAMIIAVLATPYLRALSGYPLFLTQISIPQFLLFCFAIIIIIGFLANLYPAMILSSFKPIDVIQSRASRGKAGVWVRRILVTFQFFISIALIAATVIVLQQLNFFKNKNLGFNSEMVVAIPLKAREGDQNETIKKELQKLPGVLTVSASSNIPGEPVGKSGYLPEGYDIKEVLSWETVYADHNYLKAIDADLVKGRDFSESFQTDEMEAFIINETAAKVLKFDTVVGKGMSWDWQKVVKNGTVIGIVKDFHMGSFHNPIAPLAIHILPDRARHLLVRIAPQISLSATQEKLKLIENKWQELLPDFPFEYVFLDDKFAKLYRSEEQVSRISLFAAMIALIIACIGLFGLASFLLEKRQKEISIRKIVGATTGHVLYLISKDFILFILLSAVIAIPVVYHFMNQWLEGFAYRIDISLLPFILALAIALLIAILSIANHSIRAAKINPADILKYE